MYMDNKCIDEYRKLKTCFLVNNIEGIWYRAHCNELKELIISCINKKTKNKNK